MCENLSEYTDKEIEKLTSVLETHRFLLLTGGTGVGKTMYAKCIAKKMKAEEIKICSFHRGYCYDNFVYGSSLQTRNGAIYYQEQEQIFLGLCRKAEDTSNKIILIIDDINRADVSQTLGDLLLAVESGDFGNTVHGITLPDNLYIIATMNDIIGKEKLDYAWMRRFYQYRIRADAEHFGKDEDLGFCYEEDEDKKSDEDKKELLMRQYQKEIYTRIEIMYDRYYSETEMAERNCYMPGHGIFMTFNKEYDYGKNLILFHETLLHIIVPFLYQQLSDGILMEDAWLDIRALELLARGDEENKGSFDEKRTPGRGRHPELWNEKYKDLFKNKENSWYAQYLFQFQCYELIRCVISKDNYEKRKKKYNKRCYFVDKTDFRDKYYTDPKTQYSGYKALSEKFMELSFEKDNGKKIGFSCQMQLNSDYRSKSGKNLKSNSDNNIDEIFRQLLKKSQERYINRMNKIETEKKSGNMCMKNEEYIKIMDDLEIRQMILQGPPGTSKTYRAKDIVYEYIKGKEEEEEKKKREKEGILKYYQIKSDDNQDNKKRFGWGIVQFHPSYCYEDFVRGITVKTSNSNIEYITENKIFAKMCEVAEAKEEGKYFLIIDEINRADLSNVLGELIYALEYWNEEISTPYIKPEYIKTESGNPTKIPENGTEVPDNSKKDSDNGKKDSDNSEKNSGNSNKVPDNSIKVPDNLYIIATMNTADKSIGKIDYAIRRRFLFFDCIPDVTKIKNPIAGNIFKNLKLFVKDTISSGYKAENFYIGHTYFMVKDNDLLEKRLEYQILPILREYYEDGIIDLKKVSENTFPELIGYLKGDIEEGKTKIGSIYQELAANYEKDEIRS